MSSGVHVTTVQSSASIVFSDIDDRSCYNSHSLSIKFTNSYGIFEKKKSELVSHLSNMDRILNITEDDIVRRVRIDPSVIT